MIEPKLGMMILVMACKKRKEDTYGIAKVPSHPLFAESAMSVFDGDKITIKASTGEAPQHITRKHTPHTPRNLKLERGKVHHWNVIIPDALTSGGKVRYVMATYLNDTVEITVRPGEAQS